MLHLEKDLFRNKTFQINFDLHFRIISCRIHVQCTLCILCNDFCYVKWGLKGGISIDADYGPLRYVL